MYTTQSQKMSVVERSLFAYSQNIIQYALTNAQFAANFAQAIRAQAWPIESQTQYQPASTHLMPLDTDDAVLIARWITHTLQIHPEYSTTRSLLAQWAQNYESPKDMVLGIVGLAIIGPTLGIISSKKKKKRKSQLVIEKSYFSQLSKKELATLSTQLTQSVIAQETKLVGGNVYNLHPDSAAWCIEEALTQIYTNSKENLESLLQTASADKLSHISAKDTDGNIQAVVISPSVNDSLVDESEAEKI